MGARVGDRPRGRRALTTASWNEQQPGGRQQGGVGGSPRTQPYCVGTAKLPLSLLPSSPFSVSCSSFCKGVTFLSRADSPGTRAAAGRHGPAYPGCSSCALAFTCSSFLKVPWSFGDLASKGEDSVRRAGHAGQVGDKSTLPPHCTLNHMRYQGRGSGGPPQGEGRGVVNAR